MTELEQLLEETRRTAWLIGALGVLTALSLRQASRSAARQLAHLAALEAAALSCAACQPAAGGAP